MKNWAIAFIIGALLGTQAFAYVPYAVTSGANKQRIEMASLSCTASSAIVYQTSSWISSLSNNSPGSGRCTVTVTTGVFGNANILCALTDNATGALNNLYAVDVSNATTINIRAQDARTSTFPSSYTVNLMCMGTRP